MKTDYAHIAIVLDRSGSMSSIKADAEGGLNEFLETHRKASGTATVTVAKFDTEYELAHDFKPIAEVHKVEIEPRGMTALLDAIGKTITVTGEKLRALPEDQRPEHVFFLIVTDGLENSSREFKREAVKAMIETQTNTYKWHFVFLGANMDAIAEAENYGIQMDSALKYAATPTGMRQAYASTTRATMGVRTRASSRIKFDEHDRRKSS